MRRSLVAGNRMWRGAVLLDETEEDGSGLVSIELLKSGKRELVPTDRIRTWDPKLRDTPHELPDPGGTRGCAGRGSGRTIGRVVNVRNEACDVYAGRPHVWFPGVENWGNEFVIGKDGDRDEVCDLYDDKVATDPEFRRKLRRRFRGVPRVGSRGYVET